MNTRYHLKDNTQLTHSDLRIGAGNFWAEPEAAVAGHARGAIQAGLWIYVRQQPDLDQRRRVGAGQRFEVAGHVIDVIDVEADAVTLDIQSPDAPGSPG